MMAQDATKSVDTPILSGLPEAHFKVEGITIDRPAVRARMAASAPTRDEQGTERPGAYGVLVDNVLGYAVIAAAPQDHWAVTTQMSIDFLGMLPQQH